MGERAVVFHTFKEGRRGRDRIRVVEIGKSWFAWADAAQVWGATVSGLVCEHAGTKGRAQVCFGATPVYTLREICEVFPHGQWEGVLLGVGQSKGDVKCFDALLHRIKPWCGLMALHSRVTRNEFHSWLPRGVPPGYTLTRRTLRHADMGGVTDSVWRFWGFTRTEIGRASCRERV